MVRHRGFTLIELVIAIVLVAIVSLSIPMMTQIQARATEGSVFQEAVYAASAKLLQTLSYPWDENSNDPNLVLEGATVLSEVVNIPGGTVAFNYTAVGCRPGFISRKCRLEDNGTIISVSNLGNDIADPVQGIDDRSAVGINLDNDAVSEHGYKHNYTMDVTVRYVSDNIGTGGMINYANTVNPNFIFSTNAVAGPTNLRLVTVTIKDENNKVINVLNAFAANIGEVKPYKRTY
ncbi:type II secretion system protein [Sulfuricurvum sp.]|uniref:prepilin-type N-terminal cleavage/methylation domain-containing protein n=1 Tax=Sulfuricurvum sp. TaxID=2025608 RepID=UPI002634B392|nr:type II secretion system protein [Sulfuricurvum sp.]MDD3597900.1 type II secretion system protein [Sulfuricurvum sp.]